jgi:hypothetical protein
MISAATKTKAGHFSPPMPPHLHGFDMSCSIFVTLASYRDSVYTEVHANSWSQL